MAASRGNEHFVKSSVEKSADCSFFRELIIFNGAVLCIIGRRTGHAAGFLLQISQGRSGRPHEEESG